MDHSASFISTKNKSLKVIVMFIAALMTFLVMTEGFSADAAAAKLSTPKMTAQINYGSEFTHPYNKQTNTIKVHWSKVKGASKYELYIKGGKYKSWKKYKTVKNTNCTVTGSENDFISVQSKGCKWLCRFCLLKDTDNKDSQNGLQQGRLGSNVPYSLS